MRRVDLRESGQMSVIVVAELHPSPEEYESTRAALVATIQAVHASEHGCELYALHEGDGRLVLIEKWSNSDGLRAHSSGPHFQGLLAELGAVGRQMKVKILKPYPVGDAAKGRI
jgi:quinol monooxygenase YgiN